MFEPLATVDETENYTFTLRDSADAILERFQGPPGSEYRRADLASYLLAGRRLLSHQDFEAAYIPYWPPGMAFLTAAVVGVFGPERYVFDMVLVSVLLWAFALTMMYWALRPRGRARFAVFAFLAALWALPALRTFNFGFGSLMSEASSTAFFVVYVAMVAGGLWRRSFVTIALAGVPLAIATYLRVFFEIGAWFLVLLPAVGVLVVALLVQLYRHTPIGALARELWPLKNRRTPIPWLVRAGAAMVVALVLMHGLIAPWRVYRKAHFGSTQLTNFKTGYIWGWAWEPTEKLPWYHQTGNTACVVDPKLCKVIRENKDDLTGDHIRNTSVMTLLSKPKPWLTHKLKNFNWIWIGRDWNTIAKRPVLAIEGFLLLLFGAFGLVALGSRAVRSRDVNAGFLFLLTLGFVLMNAAIFTLFQYEWRYTQSLRTLMFIAPLLAYGCRIWSPSTSGSD